MTLSPNSMKKILAEFPKKELAENCHMTYNSLWRIITGRRGVSKRNAILLARELGVGVSDVIEFSRHMQENAIRRGLTDVVYDKGDFKLRNLDRLVGGMPEGMDTIDESNMKMEDEDEDI